ncbi:hypothetical protein HAX54_013256 [Datura stramonium]|uniref:Uncharacterized protein n=1 Tax=Datura stramonium TaxID=4076 RepID=A0ABS8TMX9_DATST|nr:hypothetical protein [Datura stramonium]
MHKFFHAEHAAWHGTGRATCIAWHDAWHSQPLPLACQVPTCAITSMLSSYFLNIIFSPSLAYYTYKIWANHSGVLREQRDQMIVSDVPFNPLRVKGAPGHAERRERPIRTRSTTIAKEAVKLGMVLPGLLAFLSGIKKLLRTLAPHSNIPKVPREDALQFSFLGGLDNGESGGLGSGSNERVRYGDPRLTVADFRMFDRYTIAALPLQKKSHCSMNTFAATKLARYQLNSTQANNKLGQHDRKE